MCAHVHHTALNKRAVYYCETDLNIYRIELSQNLRTFKYTLLGHEAAAALPDDARERQTYLQGYSHHLETIAYTHHGVVASRISCDLTYLAVAALTVAALPCVLSGNQRVTCVSQVSKGVPLSNCCASS
jgi:hypothetical protein